MLHRTLIIRTVMATLLLLCSSKQGFAGEGNPDGIQPFSGNPYYWQYKGQPILLLGGTDDDNLFQLPNLEEHLDLLRSSGGNYIRNTMSDRPDKGFEVYPFKMLENGKYDLGEWNEEYWSRFADMLRWTHERDIIVQIELWDRFDYSDHKGDRWLRHPYNPSNNVNYTHAESGLKRRYRQHPGSNENPFFYTVPALRNNTVVLPFQQARIDKMLSLSLQYPHVLYCMDNETSGSPEWGKYWAGYIREKVRKAGVEVQTTEMWDSWNLGHAHHRETFDHPETYAFVDVSQNNHQKGQRHWDNFQAQRARIAESPRPLNNVKIYGADGGQFGNQQGALERFWRNLIGGAASSRFHRPDAGIGLSETAQAHLKSARLLTAEFDFVQATPDRASRLLSDRESNEAYLTYVAGRQYAVYFPKGGSVGLDLSDVSGTLKVKWLEIARSRWQPEDQADGGGTLELTAPDSGHWVALVTK